MGGANANAKLGDGESAGKEALRSGYPGGAQSPGKRPPPPPEAGCWRGGGGPGGKGPGPPGKAGRVGARAQGLHLYTHLSQEGRDS